MSYNGILTAFNIWIGPDSYLGRSTQFDPPDINSILQDYRGGGLDGPIQIDMGVELGESTITFGGFEEKALARVGLPEEDTQIIARGGLRGQGDPDAKQLVVTQTGKVSVADLGTWTPGESAALVLTMRPHYYKIEHEGTKIVEIDLVNMVRFVGGQDRLESLRSAIGV